MRIVVFLCGLIVLVLLMISSVVYGQMNDPYGMIRYIVRQFIVVPVATGLAILAVRVFDHYTPPVRWIEKVAENETAVAIVLAALIFGVFWLCVQG